MHSILSEKNWALEKNFFDRTSQLILNRLATGKDLSVLQQIAVKNPDIVSPETPKASAFQGVSMHWESEIGAPVYELEDGRKIARVSAIGTLTKYGDMCSYGSMELAARIQRADASKKVDAILMVVDGPGGSVSGTTQMGLAIRNTQKPFIAFVDEMAASAHYWITSQADYIFGNSQEYTKVGSIGVLCMLVSEREWLKKEGIEVEIMRAEQSVDKARLNSIEGWPEEELKSLQTELNDLAEDFFDAVKAGRGDRLAQTDENIFTGKMYDLSKAIELGMVDYAGTLSDAVVFAADLAKSRRNATI